MKTSSATRRTALPGAALTVVVAQPGSLLAYTDGSTSTATVGFSDWTLGGNSNPVAYGNAVAAKSAYRNSTSGSSQRINAYIFVTAPIALDTTKTIKGITLPNSSGHLHVFGITTG
jgi:hypothetical protein